MQAFEDAWSNAAKPRDGELVSAQLRPLLKSVYFHVLSRPTDLVGLKKSLEQLLGFLAGEGRTNANCWAADLFFCLHFEWAETALPEDFHNVFTKMGEALHDTVLAPRVARDYGCLPEQLLEGVRRLDVGTPIT